MPKEFIDRFPRMDKLISKKATGNPLELAQKLAISKSTLFEYISVMKELGAPVKYDKEKFTYYYKPVGRFKIKVFEEKS